MARLIARELMDDDASAGLADWRGSLHDLARVNRLLGVRRVLRLELERLPRLPRSIIDVGTGAADIPAFAIKYLRLRGVNATCVATDRSPQFLAIAAERIGANPDIRLEIAAAADLPFADRSFDVGMFNSALHHFDGQSAVQALRELARVAQTVIVTDLRRSRIAWAFARWVFPLFTHNRFTLHDGPVSVLRAYTPDEARALAVAAGWTKISVRSYAGYRMAIVGGCS